VHFRLVLAFFLLHPVGSGTLLGTMQPLVERIIEILSRSLDTTKVEEWHVRTNGRLRKLWRYLGRESIKSHRNVYKVPLCTPRSQRDEVRK
jgi:hypothetical protein